MASHIIEIPQERHWPAISDLIAEAIPNAIVSHLGTSFGSLYYNNIPFCSLLPLDKKTEGCKGAFTLKTLKEQKPKVLFCFPPIDNYTSKDTIDLIINYL